MNFYTEMKKVFFYTLFFWAILGAFTLYKSLLLERYNVEVVRQGYNILIALMLAKIIVLGEYFHLSKLFENKPLIVPTLYKTLFFSLLVFLFKIGEEFVIGFFEHRTFQQSYEKLLSFQTDQLLSELLILSFVFFLFFAFKELARTLPPGQLYALFFKKQN